MVLPVEVRRERIQRALDARGPDDETLRLPWQNDFEIFPVVKIPVSATVLTPRSHRIRAQLESHSRAGIVRQDPFGEDAQTIIREVLHNLDPPNFSELLDNLRADGQRDPGVVTREGLLVNANRRATALHDLRQQYIRVAVLPPDAGELEIDQVELRLQIQRDFKDPYTFTNELAFVHDLTADYGYDDARVARELGWTSASDPSQVDQGVLLVQQARRMLALIRETQERAHGTNPLPLTFFDDKRQSMLELDEAAQRLADDPSAADRLKDGRVLGMLASQGYQPLRSIDENFSDYLRPHVDENEVLLGILATSQAMVSGSPTDPPGLDIFDDKAELGGATTSDLLDASLEACASGEAVIAPSEPNGSQTLVEWADVQAELSTTVRAAAEDAAEDRRFANDLDAPRRHLRAAIDSMRKSNARLDRVVSRPELDRGQLKRLADEMVDRAQMLGDRIQALPD